MKQVLESLGSGKTEVTDVPCPRVRPGCILIRTRASLISAGTERMLIEFGKASLIQKAKQQPDKVKQTLDKVKTDGLMPTINAVKSKLDQPLPLGYCNAGVVLEVGSGVEGFEVGQRVVSNGHHAEVVCIPKNLCAAVPDDVDDEDAAFTVLGAIALQGIRLVNPTLGETIVVTGLGLIGLLTVQLLRANGCRVLGIDFDRKRCDLAEELGAITVCLSEGQDPEEEAKAYSRGRGVDGVIITAATKSSGPVHQAAQMCRKRGRIVLVGVTGLELSRADFFEKELTFQVSCSYGPGRYDQNYEAGGSDYPLGFVRWTVQRNFEAFLDMVASGAVNLKPLITHRIKIEEAEKAYDLVSEGGSSLGIVLQYSDELTRPNDLLRDRTVTMLPAAEARPVEPAVGLIGSGSYATSVLMPALKQTQAHLKAVASSTGISATQAAKRFGFEQATTDSDRLFTSQDINTLIISTRHDTHAPMVCRALREGKHVFVEKPLALTYEQLDQIQETYSSLNASKPILMVGFNRRFAPQVVKMKALLDTVSEPKSFIMTVNAGAIPPDHWTQDPFTGGGRIIGEGCHWIDLLYFLAGSPIREVKGVRIGAAPGIQVRDDKSTLILEFADGSFGTIHYLANGHRSFPKERLEVFCAGKVLQIDNYRSMKGYGWKGFTTMNLRRQDKGNAACVAEFIKAVASGAPSPIPMEDLIESSYATLRAADALRETV
jgi:predicted dehydrogenase/threonine dehydrogenase-like Zn-dependent dehydrogenase